MITANQLQYWSLQETKRANRAKEDELNRSNLANEQENIRSNVAKETETNRANLAKELETNRANVEKERLNWASASPLAQAMYQVFGSSAPGSKDVISRITPNKVGDTIEDIKSVFEQPVPTNDFSVGSSRSGSGGGYRSGR